MSSLDYSPPPCCRSALTRGGGGKIQKIAKILKIFPLRGAKNRRKTSFLDVSEQVRITFFSTDFFLRDKRSRWLRCPIVTSRKGTVLELFTGVGTRFYRSQKYLQVACTQSPSPRCFHEGRNAPLPFVKSIFKLHMRGPRFPDVFTRVRTRRYHSQKVFMNCIGAVPV